MRFFCDIEGLEGNWVDVGESWTRGEVNALNSAGEDETLALFHKKVTACHLEAANGGEIATRADEVTAQFIDAIDIRLVGFIGAVLPRAVRQLQALGNAAVRLSSDSSARQTAPKSLMN